VESTTDIPQVVFNTESETYPYPLDIPSPILLSGSMVLAIVAVGSLFSLQTGGVLGFGPTAILAAIGFPTAIYLFYASILKAQAETAADDAEFLKVPKQKDSFF